MVVTVHVTVSFDPKDSQIFLDALKELWLQVKEQEEDILFFDVSENVEEPGTFHMVEVWAKDLDYLSTTQLNKPYYGSYHEKTQHLWTKDRVIKIARRLDGWTMIVPKRLENNA